MTSMARHLGSYGLSQTQCEFLIEHIDIGRPITHATHDDATRNRMLRLEFIRYDAPGGTITPTRTVLTDHGREVVGEILGRYADLLIKAKYLDNATIESLLSRITHNVTRESCSAEAAPLPPLRQRTAYGPLPANVTRRGKRADQSGDKPCIPKR